jgi:two-component system, OmpR family, alkaline phosphatase synthesis response regulator PhoP
MADGKKRILLVDDEPDILLTTGKRLEIAGFELLTAEDGEEALQKAQENPDLIILDLMLPKRSGLDVCATLRKDNRFDKTPILLYTAKGGDDVIGRLGQDQNVLKEWGADGYVQKTAGPNVLLNKIAELLRTPRATDS